MESQLTTDILKLTLGNLLKSGQYPYMASLQNQIPLLTIKELEYTGSGLFINFDINAAMQLHKADIAPRDDGNEVEMWDGPELRNDELGILADTMIYIRSGYVDCIEIWNKTGTDYPINEPIHYELHWKGENDFEKVIVR
jgi:hypothetical protein